MKSITALLIITAIASTTLAQEFNPAAQPYVVTMRQYQAEQAALSKRRAEKNEESRRHFQEEQRKINEAKVALRTKNRSSSRAVSNDTAKQRRGNLVHTAHGTYGYRYAGNQVHFQNGATATQYGNTAYFSNGATANLYGNR